MMPINTLKPYLNGRQWVRRPRWKYIGPLDRTYGTCRAPDDATLWAIEDQVWAVQHGFFVARCIEGELAVLVPLPGWKPNSQSPDITREPWYIVDDDTYVAGKPASQRNLMRTIEHAAFLQARGFERLRSFIKQQDQYGYVGRWSETIQCYDPTLTWYKVYWASTRNIKGKLHKDVLSTKPAERLVVAAHKQAQERMERAARRGERKRLLMFNKLITKRKRKEISTFAKELRDKDRMARNAVRETKKQNQQRAQQMYRGGDREYAQLYLTYVNDCFVRNVPSESSIPNGWSPAKPEAHV